jgi:hypothetical protein
MWPYDVRKMMETFGQPFDMMNSQFAFPRLPPRANIPSGLSSAGNVKNHIVKDADAMMQKLSSHHVMFQRYTAGLFNMTPSAFMPGHPMYSKMQQINTLSEENERLKQENLTLKSGLGKEKKN